MNQISRLAMVTALSAVGLAMGSTGAFATVDNIYGGGGSLSEPTIRLLMDCAGTPLSNDPANYPSNANFAGNCTTTSGAFAGFKYYLTSTGSGAGLAALITETAPSTLSGAGNGPGSSAGGASATAFNSPTDATMGTYPYPHWDVTDSDAPADSLSPIAPSTKTIAVDYATGVRAPNAKNTQANRGLMWSVPIAITPVTIPYNPTNFNFVITPAAGDNEDHKLQLSVDAVCYIYTKADSNGQVVPGAYDWSNPIFLTNSFGQTAQGPTVNNPTTGTPEIYPIPSNSVYTKNAHTGAYHVTSSFSVTPNASQGNANPIVPFARSDDSGTTYLFTLWLYGHCKAFNNAKLATVVVQPGQTKVASSAFGTQIPATTINFPAWVNTSYQGGVGGVGGTSTPAKGSGGMAAAVQATPGGVGYVAPTSVEPVKAGTVPSAYVENGYGGPSFPQNHQYVLPNVASVEASIAKVAPPPLVQLKNPAYGVNNTGVPQTIKGTTPAAWGSALNQTYFRAGNVGAYAISGLTYLFGYQCYKNDTGTNDPFSGVLNLVSYYTNAGAGGNTDADNFLLSQGLVPIDFDTASNGVDANGATRTFVRAAFDVVAVDPATKLVGVQTGAVFPNNPNGAGKLNGPYPCGTWKLDATHE